MELTNQKIIESLNKITVPEVNKPLTEYISKLEIKSKNIDLEIMLDKKAAILQNSLEKVIRTILSELTKNEYKLNLIIKTQVSENKQPLKHQTIEGSNLKAKNIIAVASGKGGVGKSTISSNLAVAIAKTGAKVGLLDADIYGPSIPIMFGVENEKPEAQKIDDKDFIIPIEKYGVKLISIGFFVREEDALIWRGAMATSAIKQLINDVDWGELDYFIIDLPPGTGDVPLTMVQTIPLTGSIIVTTPQQVAVADVVKSIAMFKSNKIEVPVLGIVENMSWFSPSDMPDKKYFIFGKGGGENLSKRFNLPILGQIQIDENVVSNADKGKPIVLDEKSIISKSFENLAQNVIKKVNDRNEKLPPTKVLTIGH